MKPVVLKWSTLQYQALECWKMKRLFTCMVKLVCLITFNEEILLGWQDVGCECMGISLTCWAAYGTIQCKLFSSDFILQGIVLEPYVQGILLQKQDRRITWTKILFQCNQVCTFLTVQSHSLSSNIAGHRNWEQPFTKWSSTCLSAWGIWSFQILVWNYLVLT